LYVNPSNRTVYIGTHSYPAKCLCQVFFVLLCTVLLLPHVHATTVKHINTPTKVEASSGIKKAPKLKSDIATTQTVASPKLTLSTRISNVQLAGVTTVNSARSLRTLGADSIPQQPRLNVKPSTKSASAMISTNDAGLQYQARKTAAEQELEYENRLLLGLTLIFVTGLVITYLISKYRLLL